MKHFNCGRKRPDTVIRNTKHGYAAREKKHPVYKVWKSMIGRCKGINPRDFKNYAGRGIKVCRRWKTFQNFFDDMSFGYRLGLTIERIQNDKGYYKNNCRWATRWEQNQNKRNVKPITFNGKTFTKRRWAKILFGNRDLIYCRLSRGWSVERAVSTPAGKIGSNGSVTIPR